MKRLGQEATAEFNSIQKKIKALCAEMTAPLEGTPYKSYSDRLQKKINPQLDKLFIHRDQYL